jgi:integrase
MGRIGVDQDLSTHQASEVGLRRREDLNLKEYRVTIQRLKNSLTGIHPLQPDELKALKAYLKERTSAALSLFLSKRNALICDFNHILAIPSRPALLSATRPNPNTHGTSRKVIILRVR